MTSMDLASTEILDPVYRRFSRERVYLRMKRYAKSIVKHIVLITVSLTCIFPIFWMISSALKTQQTVFTDMSLIPKNPQFGNFGDAWTQGNFGVYFLNSVYYTTV